MEVEELKSFKYDCQHSTKEIVVQKYLIDGGSYFFQLYYDSYEEFIFKKKLATSLGVHIRDIAVVGSGKLGFSIKPERNSPGLYLFKNFDYEHDNNNNKKKSDLDVAIISSSLFDDQLFSLYEHTDYYRDSKFTSRNQLAKYILKGWLKPDMLPNEYSISPTINSIQYEFKKKYNREINIGIYKSWKFFESYHMNNIHNINLNLIA